MNSGFNAMGKKIPEDRKTSAIGFMQSLGITQPNDIVSKVSKFLELDKPIEAQQESLKYIDLTATYMLFAYLLTDNL